MAPQTMGRIFEAFRFTFNEKCDVEKKIFFERSLEPCYDVLGKARLFKPHDVVQEDIEENSMLLRAINTTASFVSTSADTIFSAPFTFAARWIIDRNK